VAQVLNFLGIFDFLAFWPEIFKKNNLKAIMILTYSKKAK